MTKNVIIRYRTRPEAAEENARLIEAVFVALAELEPDGFAYTSYRLGDGTSFTHIAHFDRAENPLTGLPAFTEFQRDLALRCVEPPTPTEATTLGSYRSVAQSHVQPLDDRRTSKAPDALL